MVTGFHCPVHGNGKREIIFFLGSDSEIPTTVQFRGIFYRKTPLEFFEQ